PLAEERAEALAGRAGVADVDGVIDERARPVASRYLARDERARGALAVADLGRELHGCAALDGPAHLRHERAIDVMGERRIGDRGDEAPRSILGHLRAREESGEIEPLRLPVAFDAPRREPLHTAHHFVDAAKP